MVVIKSEASYDELVERERVWDEAFDEGMWYASKRFTARDVPEPENPFRVERHRKERNRA